MSVKRIQHEFSITFNLGNYSSTKQAVTLEAELEEGEIPSDVERQLIEEAARAIEMAIAEAIDVCFKIKQEKAF